MPLRTVKCHATAVLFAALVALPIVPARASADSDATTVPLELIDNRMIVHATVNGHGPYAFVLDTGSSGIVLTPRVVAELGLHAPDMTPQGGGVGEHLVPTGRVHIDEVRIGALRFGGESAVVTDLSEIESNIGFPHLDGILGYSVLDSLWTTVDVDHRRIVFTHRAPALPRNARTVRFYGEIPEVDGTVDGIATRVVVDTGDRSAFTMFGAFATRNGYYSGHRALAHVLTGYGIGGPVYGDVFRLAQLTVFDTALSDVVARASRQRPARSRPYRKAAASAARCCGASTSSTIIRTRRSRCGPALGSRTAIRTTKRGCGSPRARMEPSSVPSRRTVPRSAPESVPVRRSSR